MLPNQKTDLYWELLEDLEAGLFGYCRAWIE